MLFMPLLFFRRIDNVLGFSRESLVAITTNIEGREWRRIDNYGENQSIRGQTVLTTLNAFSAP